MHIQDQRLQNNRLVRTKVCKKCFGRLVVRRIDDQDIVLCAADPTHEGFIAEAQATRLRHLQQLQTRDVLQNYPQFAPEPLRETCQESIDSLFP